VCVRYPYVCASESRQKATCSEISCLTSAQKRRQGSTTRKGSRKTTSHTRDPFACRSLPCLRCWHSNRRGTDGTVPALSIGPAQRRPTHTDAKEQQGRGAQIGASGSAQDRRSGRIVRVFSSACLPSLSPLLASLCPPVCSSTVRGPLNLPQVSSDGSSMRACDRGRQQ
jgi:hypothetical protein